MLASGREHVAQGPTRLYGRFSKPPHLPSPPTQPAQTTREHLSAHPTSQLESKRQELRSLPTFHTSRDPVAEPETRVSSGMGIPSCLTAGAALTAGTDRDPVEGESRAAGVQGSLGSDFTGRAQLRTPVCSWSGLLAAKDTAEGRGSWVASLSPPHGGRQCCPRIRHDSSRASPSLTSARRCFHQPRVFLSRNNLCQELTC